MAAAIDTRDGTPDSATQDQHDTVCSLCNRNNPPLKDSLCERCQRVIKKSLEENDGIPKFVSTWACSRCTLLNKINRNKCDACGLSKDSSNSKEKVSINPDLTAALKIPSISVRDRRQKDELHAQQVFENIRKYCRKNRSNFVDDSFMPDQRSVGQGSFDSVHHWLRISEIAPRSHEDRKLEWTIFSSPDPSDIQQGALGNCWLIAALALVSERPRLLEHILLTKEVNKEGAYLVRICHNGLWQATIIDDHFPATKHKHLVFTQAKRRQLYVPLIEKACAKVFGSYANLRRGNMQEGLQLLTGAPCDHMSLNAADPTFDNDLTWSQLISACLANLLIGASTGVPGITAEEYTRVHIHGNHAYSLLAVATLSTDPHRFVLVRDPHSHSKYSEDSITPKILEELNKEKSAKRSTGSFWISWSMFIRYFSSVTISTYKSDYFDIRECGKFTRSATDPVTSYRIHVPNDSFVIISLLYHRKDRATRTTHTQGFVLCDVDDSQHIGRRESFIRCVRGGFVCWSGSLPKGYYDIIPFSTSFWRDEDKSRKFTLVIQSDINLHLSMKNKAPTYLADFLIVAGMKISKHQRIGHEGNFYVTHGKLNLKLFIVENLSTSRHLCFDIDMSVARNVRHSRHADLPFKTRDCIPPKQRQLIFITEWADRHGQSAQMKYSYSHRWEHQKREAIPPIDFSHGDLHSLRRMQS